MAMAKCCPVPKCHRDPSIAALLPKAPFPSQHPCGRSGDTVPGEPGLSRTLPLADAAPGTALRPASASPWIFKALHCHELITGCAAAASSLVYIISRFVAFALLLIYGSHLLTLNITGR